MQNADLIIIGAGPGGYEAAVRAARSGLNTVIIERRAVGGTCLNEGCIPTKCLCRSAEVLEDVRQSACHGIAVGEVSFNLAEAIRRKDEVVGKLSAGIQTLMKTPGITFVQGEARFVDAHTVAAGENTYTAPHVILATGSVTRFLPIEGARSRDVVTSTEMLDLKEVPQRLCVIGGGVIGLEFASIYRSFGSEVTVVEYCKEVLPAFDRDVAKRLRMALKKRGIRIHTAAAVTRIEELSEGGSEVFFEEKGKTGTVQADLVLMAVGRAANMDVPGLDSLDVRKTPRGICVDENMQTSVPGLYAVGDVNGLCQLAHAATFQSYRALNHVLGLKDETPLTLVPAAVFTVPEVAAVGVCEEQLEAEGVTDYKAYKSFYRANGKALAMDAGDDGFVKLLAAPDGRLLGAHILGAHASDLIHEVTAWMRTGAGMDALRTTIHAHPTLSELILSAAEA